MELGWIRPRPLLDRRLDGALTHRLTTLTAATGYGKSTLLANWAAAVGAAVHRLGPDDRDLTRLAAAVVSALRLRVADLRAETAAAGDAPLGPDARSEELARAAALAGALAETLARHLRRDVVLVLDDVDAIADTPGAIRFVEILVRAAPRRLHIVTASRDELPFPIARLRHDHQVLELDATDLALTPEETASWLHHRLGERGAALAATLHTGCGGWPAVIQAAIDGLAHADPDTWPRRAADLAAPSSLLERLIRQAYEDLPPVTRHLLQAATVLPVLTDRLASTLGAAPGTLVGLACRGLFLEADHEGYRLLPTSRYVLSRHAPLDRHEAHDVAAVAARWYADNGELPFALRAAVAADHHDLISSLLSDHGPLLAEWPDDLLRALDQLPAATRDTPALVRLAGIAHQNRGDWDQAETLLARAAAGPAFDASAAWRLGLVHHLRGELGPALTVYRRGADHGRPAPDAAVCVAMAASVLWLRGERDGCAALAEHALEQAAAAGDPRALAAAHTVLAMLAALDGDGRANDAHYLRALEHAERAGDVVQQIRVHTNRASHRHSEGAFQEALTELEIAIRLADLTGFAPFAALALSNRAETLIRLGRLEEAAVDAADAAARWEALGSRVAYGLNSLAQVQVLRGDHAAAATYRRAVTRAEQSGDVQALGIALSGLAELLVQEAPDEAARLATWALKHRDGMAAITARLAAARVALAGGRLGVARSLLDEAAPVAAGRRDRAGLAAIAGLRAVMDRDPGRADEAVRRWAEVGDPVGQARAELVRASLGDRGAAAEVARDVRTRMHAIGCRALDAEIEAQLTGVAENVRAGVLVETLGTFRVVRGGAAVARGAWQSRKARDLLKVLVSRQGRPVARAQLVEILWPNQPAEDEAVMLKRLNVMVSTLRAVLDPDHAHGPDHIVVSDAGSLRLDLAHITVDVDEFLALVAAANRLDETGRPADALDRWRAAEASYRGEFCEEDPYADWAVVLREQARLAYVQAAGRVAAGEAAAGRYEQAARYWLRVLERDPYDERAHLHLVRVLEVAGRRGDARRRYQVYAERMRELDIEPSPYPGGALSPVATPTEHHLAEPRA
ncbi:MAG TPA: BTAD domain-containing putative transcriptional regulator [Actinoplanes sp.]|nr:BTAD domain-containing putative transcriptional regulator [Actinoplanes sp.]